MRCRCAGFLGVMCCMCCCCLPPAADAAEDAARTEQLPDALVASGIGAESVLTAREASGVRGQFAMPQLLETLAADLQARAAAIDPTGVYQAALELQNARPVEVSPGINFFSGFFFGDGLVVNAVDGRGAIVGELPGTALFLSNLQGSFSFRRDADGAVQLVTGGSH